MVAAAAGSAVGLGNIWRFPSQTADGGGALFILIYVACVLFFGVPLMMAEFIIGRSAQTNASGAFTKLASGTQWKWVGRLGILASFLILAFYLVVCGWTLDYFFFSVTGKLSAVADFSATFNGLVENGIRQTILMILFTLLTAYFIVSGVKKGIEKSAKVLMPFLFLLLIILAVRALTLKGAVSGLSFLFKPSLTHLKPTMFLDAMGQAFFSLSLGMGCMLTYASYFQKDTNLVKTAVHVSVLDTLVAILAGLIIFPSAFALASSPDAIVSKLIAGGPGLLFITLPELFEQLPMPMVWSAMFFLLLAVAALTSTISLMEVITAYLHEEFGISRFKSVVWVVVGLITVGTFCSFYVPFFNFLDFATAKIMLPISGLLISVFVGWYIDRRLVYSEINNNNNLSFGHRFLKAYVFILRYIAPPLIIIIFLYGLIQGS